MSKTNDVNSTELLAVAEYHEREFRQHAEWAAGHREAAERIAQTGIGNHGLAVRHAERNAEIASWHQSAMDACKNAANALAHLPGEITGE